MPFVTRRSKKPKISGVPGMPKPKMISQKPKKLKKSFGV